VAPGRPHVGKEEDFLAIAQGDEEKWYCEHYVAQAQRDRNIAAQADPTRQPGCESGARHAPGEDIHQGRELANKRRCMRTRASTDVREGERFSHPGDPEPLWRGVSAAQDMDRRVPHFKSGGISTRRGCVWLPLARRVNVDRVLHTLLCRQNFFRNTRAIHSGHTAASSI
jgi:hypothetical protein